MRIEEKTIGGFKYRMEQVGTETGEQILLRLSRPLAGLLSRAAAGGKGTASAKELLLGGLGPALAELKGSDLRYCRKKLAAKTVVFIPDGKQMREWPLTEIYDEHFAGRYADAAAWFAWGLKLNRFFGNALETLEGMVRASIAEYAKNKASDSKSRLEPAGAGGSGDSSSSSTDARA